jgi:hypothetical protein
VATLVESVVLAVAVVRVGGGQLVAVATAEEELVVAAMAVVAWVVVAWVEAARAVAVMAEAVAAREVVAKVMV